MSQSTICIDMSLMSKLLREGVSIEEFNLLYLLRNGHKDLLESYLGKGRSVDQKRVSLQSLVRKGLVTLKGSETFKLEDYEVTERGRKICDDSHEEVKVVKLEDITGVPTNRTDEQKTEFDLFIDKYLELFPKGIKNGGNKPLRSNATDVKAKMYKFMNKYLHTKDVILKATSNYLERLRGSYTYCPTAEYFIMKDGSSALATECEMVKNGVSEGEGFNPFEKRM